MLTEILINVPATGGPEPAVNYGLSVAKAFGAHATGVSFGLESIIAPAYFGAIPGEIIAQIRREAEESAKSAADGFMKAANGAGVEADARPIVAELKDPQVFKDIEVDMDTVVWANGLDLAPEFLYERMTSREVV